MRVIGITGGVGSGKSEVLNYLKDRYEAVIMEADKTGHKLLSENKEVISAVTEIFGKEIRNEQEEIDREKLGRLCFENSEKLEALNQVIHPAVKKEFLLERERAERQKKKIFVIEAALLIECGYKKDVDSLWYIYCDREIRIDRLIRNRGYSREKCESIMGNQVDETVFREYCDVIIDNSKDLNFMYIQVDRNIEGA